MTAKNLPSPDLLRKLLRYDPYSGKLYWRERTPDMFTDGKYSAERCCLAWNSKFADKEAFTALRNGYHFGAIFDCLYYAHRVIWAICHGKWPTAQIDHINGDRHDNKIKNLRSVSNAENMRNRKTSEVNTTGVMGVYWYKSRKKWHAQIAFNGVKKHLGYFDDKADAIAARKSAEAKYGFHPNHGRQT